MISPSSLLLRRVDLGYGPIRSRNTARWAMLGACAAGSKVLLEMLGLGVEWGRPMADFWMSMDSDNIRTFQGFCSLNLGTLKLEEIIDHR